MKEEIKVYSIVEGLKELFTPKPLIKKDMTPLLFLLFC
jgi:hypothetical protein